MGHYGYTCVECPERGERGAEDDWVSYTRRKGKNTGYGRSLNLSWAVRCKTCNARYNAYKRAREAVMRLEVIRRTFHEFGGSKWKYLKFLTVTWPIELSDDPVPPVEKMKSVWVEARTKLIERFGAIGGTDVCEVVSKEVVGADGSKSRNGRRMMERTGFNLPTAMRLSTCRNTSPSPPHASGWCGATYASGRSTSMRVSAVPVSRPPMIWQRNIPANARRM